jgi:hypothetical protein
MIRRNMDHAGDLRSHRLRGEMMPLMQRAEARPRKSVPPARPHAPRREQEEPSDRLATMLFVGA